MPILDNLLKRTTAAMRKPGPEMRRAIVTAHTAAYYAGIKERTGVLPKGLSKIERGELKARVAEQLKYYDAFAAQADKMTDAATLARAQLYPGAIRASYYGARFPGLDNFPGDGQTACKTNCQCELQEKDDGVHWVLGGSEHCDDCVSLAAGSPYGA